MTNNEIVPGFDDVKLNELKLTLKVAGENLIIVSVSGQLNSYNSMAFQNAMARVLQKYDNVIFNMMNCSFVASTGIGSFVQFLKDVRPRGGKVSFAHMAPRVYEVFQLLGFTNFFKFFEDNQEAIADFVEPEQDVEIFPVVFRCPVCEKKLKAVKAGRFRCRECKTIIKVDEFGTIRMG